MARCVLLVVVVGVLAGCGNEGPVRGVGWLPLYFEPSSFTGLRLYEAEIVDVRREAVEGVRAGDRTEATHAGFVVGEDLVTLVDWSGAPRLAFEIAARFRVEDGALVHDAPEELANAMRVDLSRDALGEPAALPIAAHLAIEPTSFHVINTSYVDPILLPALDRPGRRLVEVTTSYAVWDPARCSAPDACAIADVAVRHRFHRL